MNKTKIIIIIIIVIAIGIALPLIFNNKEEVAVAVNKVLDVFQPGASSSSKCTMLSCNPENSKQYCYNGEWLDCSDDEICDNGVDDDLDGSIDAQDIDC